MTVGPLRTAALDTLGTPRLWPIGLAGFLARGGIVLFALPVVVLPSVVGLTTFIGPNSITAAGLASRFVMLIALTAGGILAALLLGTLVGAATDRALIGAIADAPRALAGQAGGAARPSLAAMVAIRLVALIPLGLALVIGGARLGQVGYQELILPSNSAAPFVVRVLLAAPEAVAVVVVGWLVSELIATIAVRLAVLEKRGVADALGRAVAWIVRRPVRSLVVMLGTTVGSILVIGPPLLVSVVAWSGVRTALLGTADPGPALGTVAVFVAAWVVGLVLAGVAATWRSAAWSLVVLGDHRGGGPPAMEGGTL